MKCVACHTRNEKVGILEKTLFDNSTLISNETNDTKRDPFEEFNSRVNHPFLKVMRAGKQRQEIGLCFH